MNDEEYYDAPPASSHTVHWRDVVYALFRRKWMILGFGFLGILGALMLKVKEEPLYQSEAALWVLYVADPLLGDLAPSRGQADTRGATMLNNETVVLKSYELSLMAAKALLSSNVTSLEITDPSQLARRIRGGLTVTVPRNSSTMIVSYKDKDPAMPQRVLSGVLTNYMLQHFEKHRAAAALGRLQKRLDETALELSQANEELYALRQQADVRDITQKHTMLEARMSQLQNEIIQTEVEIATQTERIRGAGIQVGPTRNQMAEQQRSVDPDVLEMHQQLLRELKEVQIQRSALLGLYTESHPLVVGHDARMQDLTARRQKLEAEHPVLVALTAATTLAASAPAESGFDLETAKRELGVLEARKKSLQERWQTTRDESMELTEAELAIRDKETEVAGLEAIVNQQRTIYGRAKTSEVYNPESMPNISVIEHPTPVGRVANPLDLLKQLLAVVAAFGLGIGLALVLELVVDQVVRRPAEVEKRLNIPLMISIPRLAGVDDFALALPAPLRPMVTHRKDRPTRPVMILPSLMTHAEQAYEPPAPDNQNAMVVKGPPQIAPWDLSHVMRPYFEALRDRLMLFFQLQNVNHKPKLVAVTGCAEGSGTTTIAAGLASALSEVGEGNVLLVDLNFGRGAVHPFFRGEPTRSLDKALDPEARGESRVQERLYLASGKPAEGEASSPLPKRLSSLMPKMRASDYEYIVFDMPPISETSATVALAACMDKTLLVIEAERTHRHEATQAYDKLREYKADVMSILNKHHSKAPRWLTADA